MKRVDLRYGSFACSIQGFDDPATTLETILRHLQRAVSESPVLAETGLLDDETAQAIVDDVHGSLGDGAVTMMPGLVILWDGEVEKAAPTPGDADHAARPSPAADPLAADAADDPNLAALRAALDAHDRERETEAIYDPADGDNDAPADEASGGGTMFDETDADGELALDEEAREIAADSSSVLGDDEAVDEEPEELSPGADDGGGTIFDTDMDEPETPEADRAEPAEDPGGSSIFDEPESDGTIFDEPDDGATRSAAADDIGEPDDFDDDLGPPPDDLDEEPKARMGGSFADFARQFHVAGGTDVQGSAASEADDEFVVSGISTTDIVKATKANSVPDLIAAAAASLAIVQGRMSFTRKDVLDEFDRIPGEHPKTPEAKIKGWGRLVRDGRIRAAEDDLFSLTMDERDRHRDALNR